MKPSSQQPAADQQQPLSPPEILWEFTCEFEHLIPVGSIIIWPGPHTVVLIH